MDHSTHERDDRLMDGLVKRLKNYRDLGAGALGQLDDADVHWKRHPEDNSVFTIVRHMHGNMLSRFTGFLETDGEKPWRNREEEFSEDEGGVEKLLALWTEGWDCVFGALDPLRDADLEKTVTIRSEKHTVFDAVVRQVAHYAYHVGQIVYLAKTLRGAQWKNLSVPKGGSAEFNSQMSRRFEPEK